MEDYVRVIRLYSFEGPRSAVEKQIAGSLHGEKDNGNGVLIKVATLGLFPEIMEQAPHVFEGQSLGLGKA